MTEAWIIDGVRSPRGKGKANGSLHDIHPQELLAQVLNALADRIGFDPNDVDDVIIGNGNSAGDHGACIGRMGVLAAGWPVEAPGITLNRFCGSGPAGGHVRRHGHPGRAPGARRRRRRRVDVALAGRRCAARLHRGQRQRCASAFPLVPQGISADLIATIEGFSRDDVDAFAVESQARAAKAMAEGALRSQRRADPRTRRLGRARRRRVPAARHHARGHGQAPAVVRGDGWHGSSRATTSSFDAMCTDVYPEVDHVDHVHHAGNSSGVVDGASAVLLASPDYARAHGLTATSADRDERRRRRRAGDHAHRPWPGLEEVPRAGRA